MTTDSQPVALEPAVRVMPVGELVRRVSLLLERGFPLTWISGEVSNFTRATSGHWYFSMKDREAQVRCVMFRNRNQHVDWKPREGDRVEARVLPGLYVARGEFQLQVEQMRRAGAGTLFEAFLRIKATLEAAGLFDPARKRPLPRYPRTIGVVTSMQAAALRDVLTTLARRSPHVRVVVFPTPVQGPDAPARIVDALVAATRPGAAHGVDVLLIVRGGGSIEDLWAFNDERVARAIAGAAIPTISGIGHETDFTIADFVADVRAPTPTAAAELASPDALVLATRLSQQRLGLRRAFERSLNASMQRVDDAARRLRSPAQRAAAAAARLDAVVRCLERAQATGLAGAARSLADLVARLRSASPDPIVLAARNRMLADRLVRAMSRRVLVAAGVSGSASQRLALLDPRRILERGYAIATTGTGEIVRDAAAVHEGERLTIEVASGSFEADVAAPSARSRRRREREAPAVSRSLNVAGSYRSIDGDG